MIYFTKLNSYILALALCYTVSAYGQEVQHATGTFGSPSTHYDSTKTVTDNGGNIKVEQIATTPKNAGYALIVTDERKNDSMSHFADTVLAHQLTIKINPGLLFMEQGLSLQYNLQNNFGIQLGFGINEDNSGNNGFHTYDGSGYTLRGGVIQYLDAPKKWYFVFEGFYRYYGNISAVAQHSQGFTQGIDDEVINPLRDNLGTVSAGDGQQVDAYTAHVKVYCFDAVVGYQYRKKHFVLDMFAGLGSRSKSIRLHEVGYYVNAMGNTDETMIPYNTLQSKSVAISYVDVKLGFTLGYRIF